MKAVFLAFLLVGGLQAEEPAADTARLAARLKEVSVRDWRGEREFNEVSELLAAWVDARVADERSAGEMRQELEQATVLVPELDHLKFIPWVGNRHRRSPFWGHVSGVTEWALRGGEGALVIVTGLYYGSTRCDERDAVLMYDRQSQRRIALFRHPQEKRDWARQLLSIDGEQQAGGGWLVASAWSSPSCAVGGNGDPVVRIARIQGGVLRTLLEQTYRAVQSFPREQGTSPEARVRGQEVTFTCRPLAIATFDGNGIASSSMRRYELRGERMERTAPLATSRAALLSEWQSSTAEEARGLFGPTLLAARDRVFKGTQGHTGEWGRVARCSGAEGVREFELVLRSYQSGTKRHGTAAGLDTRIVFRLSGETAKELKLLAITDRMSGGCAELSRSEGLAELVTQLP